MIRLEYQNNKFFKEKVITEDIKILNRNIESFINYQQD